MKQTAVVWLQKSLSLTFEQQMQFEGLFQQAIEMEKEQILEAFINGEVARDRIDCIEYYEETYGK
jgi:hypothetical protein